ncbi:transferase-like protein [Thermochaetoides thermophila DSM 1495]|uniref:protein O-GlcNAc transferase n=1 Tax=Chaetomium thermophilum (strain DSM 1495 / CBS 144.50 / IMI 039719) TaxID=759272 RepID=G0SGH9_CHATD|nr:transferase-like protein [Thermochaetoides thermophila DSM 1495]EGS17318.1 transferase-like protein [Thermochaetoides thermophila DSM 1495]
MLPLLQTHHTVQPQFDFFGSHQPHHLRSDYAYPHHAHHSLNQSSARAVPTRSIPYGHGLSLHRYSNSLSRIGAQDPAEHSLRRKTPSGTIDNGYDGSLGSLASGPPPLKHMIVPASTANIFPTAVAQRAAPPQTTEQSIVQRQQQQDSAQAAWPQPFAQPQPAARVGHGNETLNGSAAMPRAWPGSGIMDTRLANSSVGFLQQPGSRHSFHSVPDMQTLLGPGFQQPLSQPIFNPAGCQQQPANWRDSGFGYRPAVPMPNGFAPPNPADSVFMPAQAPPLPGGLVNPPGLGQPQQFGIVMPSHPPIDDGFSRYNQSHLAQQNVAQNQRMPISFAQIHSGGTYPQGYASGTVEPHSPAGFRERVLQQAHRAYSELLTYISAKRSNQAAHASSVASKSQSKLMVYPKASAAPGTFVSRPRTYVAPSNQVASYAQQMEVQAYAARRQSWVDSASNMLSGQASYGNTTSYITTAHQMQFPDASSPVANAKSSLELIHSLCEQSGWKWIEGMLLGGCLQYGLERYEQALEWFRRIVSLDPSHVEAISNIAATLYCMNRLDEAEQHWLRAIELRPSYLEAAEHLVSILCAAHRNHNAIERIEYVQRLLRLPRPDVPVDHSVESASEADTASTVTAAEEAPDHYLLDSDKTDSPEQRFALTAEDKAPGFGSSGYAIPGSENGRMCLLIHTKGNLLYAMKDINRASDAFEEVIRISTGGVHGVKSLIRKIQSSLSPCDPLTGQLRSSSQGGISAPLLLPPSKAKMTAQHVFSSTGGQLPGFQYIPEGPHKRSAVATTSNSLLSLAKIFQDAMSNTGPAPTLNRQPASVGDILALYYLSMSLQESPSTANNVGILLAGIQQTIPLQQLTPDELKVCQTIHGIVPGSGLHLALCYYSHGLQLDKNHVHLHTNLGSLLKDVGHLDMAISMYEKAVQCDGTFDIALTNLANAVKDRGRIGEAINYYKRAVAANPDFAEAICGLSTALGSVCDWKGRGGVLLEGGKYDRWHVDDKGMLLDARIQGQSSGLMKRVIDTVARQLRESSLWGCGYLQQHTITQLAAQLREAGALLTDPGLDLETRLKEWAGRPYEGYRILRLVERSTRAAMRLWYLDKLNGVTSHPGYRRPKPPANLPIPSAPTVLPFHTFTCPLPAKEVRMISQRNAWRISFSTLRSPWIPSVVYEPPDPPNPHLNVGYVSSDFNNHPLAHLMQSVFGMHNPRRVKAFCYATSPSDNSIHRQQIEREAPVFRDVSSWSSERLVEQIVKDKIHILVNLNGYTRGARNEIFAARPAPIQMSFMGFAGTLGAEWCDYLLADTTAVPPSTLRPHRSNLNLEDVFRDEADADTEGWIYSENLIYCRETFFCCDHAQSADGCRNRDATWDQEALERWKMRKKLFPDLPDDAVILGNFNQLYKIDPTTFRTWLRILAACPKAYLWLLRFPDLGERNLMETARAWSGNAVASRIRFTDVAPKQDHISRAKVCDLFLDTPECNAHTTAADVLWSSTPLLTLPRYPYKMCSRMAASILRGALPRGPLGDQAARELVCADEREYEERAVALANGMSWKRIYYVDSSTGGSNYYCEPVGRLGELRRLLFESKWNCALFDTRRWVRDLEEAYEKAWRNWVEGIPGDIWL